MGFLGPPLKRVMNELGRAVLADMHSTPGLTAAIDQHAAAVREAVVPSGSRIDQENLADYLHGIMDSTHEGGWPDTQFLSTYSWPTLRIAAVCWLAREQGFVA